jgi:hypothetical protein
MTTMQTKPKFDPNSPEIKAYENELAHQFVREGMMVAFPTCLPGMTTPIPLDESRITALTFMVERADARRTFLGRLSITLLGSCSMPESFRAARAPRRFVVEPRALSLL